MRQTKAQPCDYDENPERFLKNVKATEKYSGGDVHEEIAERFADEGMGQVLDLGCGEGRLVRPLHQKKIPVVAFDYSKRMLAAVSGRRVQGNATALPFEAKVFDAVAALYMLYHIEKPEVVLKECHRVLRSGGAFVATAPSRYNDPELAEVLAYGEPETFDAENGPELVGEYFDVVEIERWDAPLIHLPSQEALSLYLAGRGLSDQEIQNALIKIETPLDLTKRGALIFAKKL